MVLPQIFSQKDLRWAAKPLGTSSSTIGDYGCLLAVMATLAGYFGKDTDPDRLNQALVNVQGYQSGNLYKWFGGISKVYSDISCTKLKNTPYPLTHTDFREIDEQLQRNKPVVAQVDFVPSTAPVDMHYVLIIDGQEGEYTVADPWYGDVASLKRYGEVRSTIQQYALHEGPISPVTQPSPTPQPTTLSQQERYALAFIKERSRPEDNPESLVREWWEAQRLLLVEREKSAGLESRIIELENRISLPPPSSPEWENKHKELLEEIRQILGLTSSEEQTILQAIKSTKELTTALKLIIHKGTELSTSQGWEEFLNRLKSRKLILAGVGAAVSLGNSTFGWGLSTDQVLTVLAPLLAYIGVEGVADIVERGQPDKVS